MAIPIVLSWSGGKDCAMALYYLKQQPAYKVAYLLTTITETYNRISMHGVSYELLQQQATALQLPLITVNIPPQCTNEEYEKRMLDTLKRLKNEGINTYAFGDIFLTDVRSYREQQLAQLSLKAVFPLWGYDTAILAQEFIKKGFKAIICCADTQQIDASFTGRDYSANLLHELPSTADPCGENGEFHTFVFDGPIFSHPIRIRKGETVMRDNRFSYCDIMIA